MSRHRRTAWLMSLLDRVRRDRRSSTVRYLDEHGRRATAVVRSAQGFVKLEGADFEPVYLSATEVARLRAELRSAVFDLDKLCL